MKKVFAVTAALALLGFSIVASADVFNLGAGFTNLETVTVGDPGNVGLGSVGYTYNIGKYEVTAKQYTDFLNNKAQTDMYELYNTYMASAWSCNIQRSGAWGSYTYSVEDDWANRPVNYVSFWDACRFANWLSNGQGNGDTETGAYTLNGYNDIDGRSIQRNAGPTWAVTSEDEWVKAAYYKGGGSNAGYWDYPTRSNTVPGRDMADASGNNANYCDFLPERSYLIGSPYYRTEVGEFQNSDSPYGTFDQGGNVAELNEAIVQAEGSYGATRGCRGGSYDYASSILRADNRYHWDDFHDWILFFPTVERYDVGFRVTQIPDLLQPPANMSLSPSTAKIALGVTRTFTTVYTDINGYADIAQCCLLFNTTINGVGAAYLMYDQVTNKLYLRNNSNTAWIGGYAPGSTNTIENSQCKLYCAETNTSGLGYNLTVNWVVEFKQPIADKTTTTNNLKAWTFVVDKEKLSYGWTLKGNYTWLYPKSLTPASAKLVPGIKQTFTSVYRDDDGYADISVCILRFNTTPDISRSASFQYDSVANKLYLWNDAKKGWGTGYTLGSHNIIENDYCKIYCAETTKSVSGNLMTINWRIEFKQLMADKILILRAWDWMLGKKKNLASGWLLGGEYTWMSASNLTPSSGKLVVGAKKTFASVYHDADGYSDIEQCYLLFNTDISGTNAAYLLYDRVANKLYLRNNANSAWLGGYAPGSANIIENSQCKLYCAETTKSSLGNDLTINWRIEFKQPLADKTSLSTPIKAWMYVSDKEKLVVGWMLRGDYKWLYPKSLTPASSKLAPGIKQTFASVYRDDDGYADISKCYTLFNTTITSKNGANVMYDAVANKLYLWNDATASWGTGYTPGSANNIENNYCKIYCAETTHSGSHLMGIYLPLPA